MKVKWFLVKLLVVLGCVWFSFAFFSWLGDKSLSARMEADVVDVYKIEDYTFKFVSSCDFRGDKCLGLTKGDKVIYMLKYSPCKGLYVTCNHEMCHNMFEQFHLYSLNEEKYCQAVDSILSHPVCDRLMVMINCTS